MGSLRSSGILLRISSILLFGGRVFRLGLLICPGSSLSPMGQIWDTDSRNGYKFRSVISHKVLASFGPCKIRTDSSGKWSWVD